MLIKKAISTIRITIAMWAVILIPLITVANHIKINTHNDITVWNDTFISSESANLSKMIGAQFRVTQYSFENIVTEIKTGKVTLTHDGKTPTKDLQKYIEQNKNIVSITVYDNEGKVKASSLAIPEGWDKSINHYGFKEGTVSYDIDQSDEDKSVVIKYNTACQLADDGQVTPTSPPAGKDATNAKAAPAGKDDKTIFVELVIKWKEYESYMNHLVVGAFPRMFFILSPDYLTHLSMNSLPNGIKGKRGVAALGLHLAKNAQSIPRGMSIQRIEGIDFRVSKNEIEMPKTLEGSKLSVVVVSDSDSVDTIAQSVTAGIPAISLILICMWFLVCIMGSRIYNKNKEHLEISDTISQSTPLAVIIFSVDTGLAFQVNSSATTMLRLDKDNNKNIDFWTIFASEDDKKYVHNAISSDIPVYNYEVMLQTIDKTMFWTMCSASPVKIEEKPYLVLAILDIHRRKEMEKKLANNAEVLEQQIKERTADLELKAIELEQSNGALEGAKEIADQANKAKSNFLTSISNELKTPLSSIIGYSEILCEESMDRKDEVTASDLKKITGAAKHLLALIDEILDLSKIEEGKVQLFLEDIDIGNTMKDIEGVTMPLITERDNSLFVDCPKDIGLMYTDGTKLRQCLINLLGNAAKFTEFGKITLKVSKTMRDLEEFIDFAVIDTGAGIAEERLDNIFEAFNKDANAPEDDKAGAGLGLSITKKYSKCLGGSVDVESTVGKGSKFTIHMPKTSKIVSGGDVYLKNDDIKAEDAKKDDHTEEKESASMFTRKSE